MTSKNKTAETDAMISYRKKAFEKLKEAKLPSFKYGLSILIKPDVDLTKIEPTKADVNVDIKRQEGVEIMHSSTFSDDTFKEFLENWKEDNHFLYHFHQAHANDFLLIRIKKDQEISKPIEIDYDLKSGSLLSSIFVICEDNSKATILLRKKGGEENTYVSDDVRILAKKSSNVHVVSIQNLHEKSIAYQRRTSHTLKDAKVKWIDACFGSKYLKSDIVNELNEEGADGNILVLFDAKERQRYDLYTASNHNSPNTYSDIVTKGVVRDKAKALSRGLVNITQTASGSNGYEQQDVLILSKDAEADAIPNLEIHNQEVKCSHGSTIGQVDDEQVFYLKTRGLTGEEAVNTIVQGYFAPILDVFEDEEIKNRILEELSW